MEKERARAKPDRLGIEVLEACPDWQFRFES